MKSSPETNHARNIVMSNHSDGDFVTGIYDVVLHILVFTRFEALRIKFSQFATFFTNLSTLSCYCTFFIRKIL